MIENRGIIKLGAPDDTNPSDSVVIIEAYEEAERLRAHQMMTENWTLIGLARRRNDDGSSYTEYRLRSPRAGQ